MAGQLTQDWIGVDFLPSQIVQAMGQSIGLTSLVWFFLKHLEPTQIFTFGAVLQTGRLFGAQLGSAFIQTFVRVREQVYSNLVGLHVTTGSLATDAAAAGLRARRERPIGWRRPRRAATRHRAARPRGADSGQRAGLHRRLHGHRLRE